MKNLNLTKIRNDFNLLKSVQNESKLVNSYINAYDEFLLYFKNIDKIEKHHFIISSHFVYGWMPTILTLNTTEIDQITTILNSAKNGKIIDSNDLETLKRAINNSLVGTSKLLHFINPKIYAIWDSRIFKYLTNKKSIYGIDKADSYLEYLEGMNAIIKNKEFKSLHTDIDNYFGHKTSPMRAIEIVMFLCDKYSINSNK